MELELTRTTRTNRSTIGELTIDRKLKSFIVGGKDRLLQQGMALSELMAAIPTSRYEIVTNFSDCFQKMLPLLPDVPAFAGIRIHPGNTDADTEGCLLPGKTKSRDMVGSSRAAFTVLFGN